MKTINTKTFDPAAHDNETVQSVYNGFDVTLTREIYDNLKGQLKEGTTKRVYDFERAMMGPALIMMRRGLKVDLGRRDAMLDKYRPRVEALAGMRKVRRRGGGSTFEFTENASQLQELVLAFRKDRLNPFSTTELKKFFYEDLRVPLIWKFDKGVKKIAMDGDALEKIRDTIPRAAPFAEIILRIRDLEKDITVLESGVDADGRMRFNLNVAGTETGRWSSNRSIFAKTGTQAQNIKKDLRSIFVADDGYLMVACDQQSAESYAVGYLSGDENYIRLCQTGDVHTGVAKMIWPELPWTGDPKKDKALAEQPYYKHHSRRFMCKKAGHGCLAAGHQVLTRRGWVKIEELPKGVEVMAWDQSTGRAKWSVPLHHIQYEYSGTLYHFEGARLNLITTHDHRMPVIAGGKAFTAQVLPAEQVAVTRDGFMTLPCTAKLDGVETSLPEDFVRLLFYVLWERARVVGQSIVWPGLKRVRSHRQDIFKRLGYASTIMVNDPNFVPLAKRIIEDPRRLLDFSGEEMGWMLDEMFRCAEVHLTAHPRGTDKVEVFRININNETARDVLVTMHFLCGFSARPESDGNVIISQSQVHTKAVGVEHYKSVVVDYPVYCLTMDTGFFYVRHAGKTCITGNSNYYGTARTLGRQMKVEEKLVTRFQLKYLGGEIDHNSLVRWGYEDLAEGNTGAMVRVKGQFEGIRTWHQDTIDELQRTGVLTTPMGRARHFWGRLSDQATFREAIAFVPQSLIADIQNTGIFNVWWNMDPSEVQVLLQIHDALLGMVREDEVHKVLPRLEEMLSIPVEVRGRTMTIPVESKAGISWGDV